MQDLRKQEVTGPAHQVLLDTLLMIFGWKAIP